MTKQLLVSAGAGSLYFILNSPAVYSLTKTFDEQNQCPTLGGNILHNIVVLGLVIFLYVFLTKIILKVPELTNSELALKTFFFVMIIFASQAVNSITKKLWRKEKTCPSYQMSLLHTLIYSVVFMMLFMNIKLPNVNYE